MNSFKELVVYQRAAAFADDVYRLVRHWEKFELWSIGIQLIRAADSVGANIAEAAGRWHTPDRRRLLYIARGSLAETEHWVLTAQRLNLLPGDFCDRLEDIRKPLNGLTNRSPPEPSPDTRHPTPDTS
jgi:four helix bundle protein